MTKLSIISNIVKAGALSALLVGSVAAYSTNPLKRANQDNPPQTEVVSKAGAEALKTICLQSMQQTSVPTEHNPKLDSTLRKFAINDEFAKAIDEFLSSIYKNNGTFLGTALLQHEIDRQQFGTFLDCNTDVLITNNINPELGKEIKGYGDEFYASVKPNAEDVYKWLEESYTPAIISLLNFDHVPDGDEVIKRLDFIASDKAGFNTDELIEYYVYTDNFKQNKLKNRTDIQAKSDLIAFKMFILDRLLMYSALKANGVFGKGSYYKNGKGLDKFFPRWMESVQPK